MTAVRIFFFFPLGFRVGFMNLDSETAGGLFAVVSFHFAPLEE